MEPVELAPDELHFDPYFETENSIFARFAPFFFRTGCSFWNGNLAMSILWMRGIRWFQRELLKRLIYTSFGRGEFWRFRIRFWAVLGVQEIPPWMFRLWAGWLRNRRSSRTRTGGTGFWNQNRRNWNPLMSEPDRTEPKRRLPVSLMVSVKAI